MKASVERLRWGLAGAAVLLLIVLAGFLSYGRYKARKVWQDLVRRSGIHVSHETDGFTYSQSMQGRTVFTLHAAKAVDHGDGTLTLHDVQVTLYSKTSSDEDHIQSSEVEYNQKTKVATAAGEVHMDLQAPGGLSSHAATGAASEPEGQRVIHIKTSGLVYVSKLEVAATDQPVEFRYEGMQCTSKGAEFDSGESRLHLLADVVITGNVHHAPMVVHAGRADLDRQTNTVLLQHPVAQSEGRTATAASAVLHLRKDGSLERAEGGGGVSMDAGTRHLKAVAFAGTFGLTSLPVTSKLTGSVELTDTSAVRPLHALANEVDSSFDARGNATSVLGIGAAQVAFSDRKAGSPDLAREMRGDHVLATFKPVSLPGAHKSVSRLSEIHATGAAMARGESVAKATATQAAGLKSTQVFADDLRAVFDAEAMPNSQLRQVFGNGHTRLKQDAPLGEQQTSSGDTLEVEFAAGARSKTGDAGLEIASATQVGNVTIHSVPAARPGSAKAEVASDAGAARAVYDGASSRLTLTGSAHYAQGETSLTAETIGVNQHSGDADAQGHVLATMASAPADAKSAPARPGVEQQMTHVSAERATMAHASQVAVFFGTDAHPARLWQGASQVQAASLTFDQKKRTLAARPAVAGGLVHAVFADTSQPRAVGAEKPPAKGLSTGQSDDKIARVVSAAMDYSDLDRMATFTGGVKIDGTSGQARSQRGVVFLNPAQTNATKQSGGQPTPFGGSVQKIVLSGDVQMAQPGRTGTGEQLVYTAADSSYVLTGTAAKPPHVVDAQQGNVTGATLLFHSGDNTIIVSGATSGTKQEKPGRVRTETQVKQSR